MIQLPPTKHLLILLVFFIAISPTSLSNCPFTFNFFGSGAAPTPGNNATLQTCSFIGEATTATGVVAGNQYTVDITYTSGIPPAITPFVVVYDAAFNPIFFGLSPVAFTAPTSGTYYTIPFIDAFCTSFDPNFGCNATLWSNVTSTLPVELSDFYGETYADHNVIRWETYSETDNDYFNVLRSYDGTTFDAIGKVEGVGFSQDVIQYQFDDVEVRSKITYYQLEQVDFNGSTEKSDIISLVRTSDRTGLIASYPNPTTGKVTVEASATKGSNGILSISDLNGTIVYNEEVVAGGIEKFQIDLSHLAQGIYFVRYQDEVTDQTIKLIKS